MSVSQGPSFSETILRLATGEHAPRGYEIKRVLDSYDRAIGTGTNYERVFVVAARHIDPLDAAKEQGE